MKEARTAAKHHRIHVGLTQIRCSSDPGENLKKQLRQIERAAQKGAQIVCTQELFRSQYFPQTEDHSYFALAEPIPGPTTEALQEVAKRRSLVIVGSIFEKRAEGVYHNSAIVVDADGALLGVYRKMHIPDDPLYHEKFYFSPGDTGFRAWRTRYARIGVLVCWDQWFPEAARLTALQGAHILFYPTAIGWHPSEKAEFGKAQHESWEVIQRAHAIANGSYVCVPNRVGTERILGPRGRPVSKDGIEFWGGSFVVAPDGQVLKRASRTKEEVVVVGCDLDLVEVHRTHWPFLRDRRIDAYQDLLRRYIDKAQP